jgi:hypothetical protein
MSIILVKEVRLIIVVEELDFRIKDVGLKAKGVQ